jgi:chromate transporter
VRGNTNARAFLDGAGPAAVGAILGAAVPLFAGVDEPWQLGVLAGAAVLLFAVRVGTVPVLLLAGAVGALAGSLGAGVPA